MPTMTWSEEMSVGIPELDEDHKTLIRVINQLDANAGNKARRDSVRQSLVALQRYAEFHFAREENVMAACAYPGLEDHREEHRRFIERIRQLNARFAENPESSAEVVNDELLTFLRDWLTHHIMIEDKAYRTTAESSRPAQEAARSFAGTQIWWGG